LNAIIERIRAEPVIAVTLVQSVITLVVAFGLKLTPEQIGGILLVTNAILNIIARQGVTPTSAPTLAEGTEVTTPAGVKAEVIAA
jgi:hypothetical protein